MSETFHSAGSSVEHKLIAPTEEMQFAFKLVSWSLLLVSGYKLVKGK